MSNPVPALPPNFAFTYREGELWHFHQLASRSMDQTLPAYSFWIVYGAMIFIIGFVVLGAQSSGLIGFDEVPPVLFTAYVAFYGNVILSGVLSRRRGRRVSRAAFPADGSDAAMELAFSENGMAWKTNLFSTEIGWRAIDAIEWRQGCFLIRFLQVRFLVIPGRAFADAAAQAAFLAAFRSRIGHGKT